MSSFELSSSKSSTPWVYSQFQLQLFSCSSGLTFRLKLADTELTVPVFSAIGPERSLAVNLSLPLSDKLVTPVSVQGISVHLSPFQINAVNIPCAEKISVVFSLPWYPNSYSAVMPGA